MTRYGTIIGTGRYVPETVHSNDMLKAQVSRANPDLAKVVDAFQDSSGIRARRLAPASGPRRTSPCGPRRPRWTRPASAPTRWT